MRAGPPDMLSNNRILPVISGLVPAGATVVCTVTGHGLKDTATALEGFGPVADTVVDPDVDEAARAAGLG